MSDALQPDGHLVKPNGDHSPLCEACNEWDKPTYRTIHTQCSRCGRTGDIVGHPDHLELICIHCLRKEKGV
jgi:hypothetical protein